jgi:Fe-S-cluster containining protein
MSAAEADLIACHLGLEPRDFIERYAEVTADRRSLTLIERRDGGCIMLTDENLCCINPVKPRQCREFPERWRFAGFETVCQARPEGEGTE